MKRGALAFCASLLLVSLVPGSTLAILNPTSNLDQWNDPAGLGHGASGAVNWAQTFTAGEYGLLSGVDLYLSLGGGGSLTASIEATASGLPTGPTLASASSTVAASAGWVHFSFPTPLSVVQDSVYAIVINPTAAGVWYGSTNTYPGGQAFEAGAPWSTLSDPADFGFRTYVDTVGTQLQWDKPQITAGTNTPLILTATMTDVNGVEATHYGAFLGSVPTWFTPTGITCSDTASKIVPADCTLVNFGNGFGSLIPASATGDILTFTVTGTAAPTSTDVGTPGTAMANACIDYPALGFCGDAFATVDVVAAAATPAPTSTATPAPTSTATPAPTSTATPPPTSTAIGPSSDESGSTVWFLPVALMALFGALLVLAIRRRRPIS
jgi:MYXO-CTERM domain-containing protein